MKILILAIGIMIGAVVGLVAHSVSDGVGLAVGLAGLAGLVAVGAGRLFRFL